MCVFTKNMIFCGFLNVVVGKEELESRLVNVRNRDDIGTMAKGETEPPDEIAKKLVLLKTSRSLQSKLV